MNGILHITLVSILCSSGSFLIVSLLTFYYYLKDIFLISYDYSYRYSPTSLYFTN